ncbi:hypothetical protein PAXRUDRAFT_22775, partial [Paxillus rubicundulus Ve08.2h10]
RASRVKDGAVPWVQISTQRSDYISWKYLPQGAKLREPSKLQKKEVRSLKWRGVTGSCRDPVEVDSDEEGASRKRTAAKGKRKAAPDHHPTDTEESEDDQGGPTDEEPSDVRQEPGAGSEHVDMGKQARDRGLDDEGSEEEEVNGQMQTRSEAVSNPKDSSMHQANK